MSNYADLSREAVLNSDGAVIVKHIAGLPGGRTLDLSTYKNEKDGTDVIKAGHLIIKKKTTQMVSPLDIDAQGAYVAVPEDAELIGVLEYGVTKKEPIGAILTAGQVNGKRLPYSLPEGGKEKLPRIEFLYI